MATFGETSSKLTLNYNILYTFLILLPIISSSSHNKTHINGFKATLISPLSPESPYYTQILEANNMSLTRTSSNQQPLNQTHYFEWLIKQELSYPTSKINKIDIGSEKYSTIHFRKVTGYVMKIHVGSPPQPVYGLFDTGSELVWFQCKVSQTAIPTVPTFNQFKSLTYTMIPCKDEYMCDIHTTVGIRCGSKSCEFWTDYVDGTHVEGVMGYDVALSSLSDDEKAIADFMFGCSTDHSTSSTIGIIGGGNGKYSFPMQISQFDPKFSYCISNKFSYTYQIKFGKEATLMGHRTRVSTNKNTPFYYLNVIGIKVNGRSINVSPSEFEMSSDGTRGFIIDSGSSLSYLTSTVFDAVQAVLEKILGVPDKYWIYEICYPLSRFAKMRVRQKPTITIVFAEFELLLPTVGTWDRVRQSEFLCLLFRRVDEPMSTLGLTQLWDVNVGHDLVNNLLYLSTTTCPTEL